MLENGDSTMIDGTTLRLVIFNSNDRSSSIKIYFGAFRDACSNQMVFGEDIVEPTIIRHTKKDWKHNIYDMMQQYEEVKATTEAMIERMMNKQCTFRHMQLLAEKVSKELLGDITGTILDPSQLNVAHRIEDVGKDAWSTYQRLQGNLMNGGIDRIISKTTDGITSNIVSKTHVISDEAKKIKLNRELHNMCLNFA